MPHLVIVSITELDEGEVFLVVGFRFGSRVERMDIYCGESRVRRRFLARLDRV